MMRRLLSVLGLVLCFALLGSAPAMAAGGPVNPGTPGGAQGGIDLNPLDNLGGAILDKICPQRKAPYPQAPERPIMERGGGPGTYAERGYAGTFWTTYDAGCMSMDKTDTAIGVSIDSVATSVDSMTNELQIMAQDPASTNAFESTITVALKGLAASFWDKWVLVGMVLVGALIGFALWTGRLKDATSHIVRAVLVLTVVYGVVNTPSIIFDTTKAMTNGVSTGVSEALMKTTPDTSMPPDASSQTKFGEAFYQVSNRAWLDGSFCGDKDAETRYGKRLLDAQSFSVSDIVNNDKPGALAKVAKAKQADWLKIGKEMEQTNPAGFSCWKGANTSRTSAAIKHAVVSLGAGFWVDLGSLALLALKWLLPVAMLFMVTFGAVMMFSERLADKMVGFLALGIIGPLFVSAAVGTLLWGYYAILLQPGQAWWQAGIMAFALGFALWMAKGLIGSAFNGLSHVGRKGSTVTRRAGRRFMAYSSGGASYAPAVAAGAVAGAVAGHVAAASQEAPESRGPDSRREQTVEQNERQQSVDSRRTDEPTPAPAVSYYMQQAQRTAQAKAEREGAPAPRPQAPAPAAPVAPAPEARHQPAPAAVAVAAPPKPEQDRRREPDAEPEMRHGSIRAQHGEKRHDQWTPPAAGGADSRRTDLPK